MPNYSFKSFKTKGLSHVCYKNVLKATGVVYLDLKVQSLVGITSSSLDYIIYIGSLTQMVKQYHFTWIMTFKKILE